MKWVIFDLDGTLSRTDIFIVPSIRAAMEDTGLGEWTTEEIRMTIGERTEETNLKLFGAGSGHAGYCPYQYQWYFPQL